MARPCPLVLILWRSRRCNRLNGVTMYDRQKRYGNLKAMICNGRNSASRSQHFVEQNHKHMEFSFILMTLIFLPNDRFDNPGTHRSLHSFLPVVDPPMFFFGLPPGFCSRQRFGNYGYARGACLQDEELVRVESFRRFQRCGVFIKQNRQTSGPSKKRPMGIRYSGFR